VVAGSVLVLSAPAQAHNYLVASTPEAGSTLTELPTDFVLTTNGDLLDLGDAVGGFALQVRDSAGLFYGDGCVTVDGSSMTTPAELGEAGDYTLDWQVVSADGHSISGNLEFTWAPMTDGSAGAGSASAPVCGAAASGDTEAPAEPTAPMAVSGDAPQAMNAADTATPAARMTGAPADILWTVGAVLAVLTAATFTVLLTRRQRRAG
jgi:methionine-rich copper-binding protein CopC